MRLWEKNENYKLCQSLCQSLPLVRDRGVKSCFIILLKVLRLNSSENNARNVSCRRNGTPAADISSIIFYIQSNSFDCFFGSDCFHPVGI